MKSISNKNFTDGIKEGWINVKVFLSSSTFPITGITALSYSETNTKEAVYGIGNQAIGYAVKNYEYSGSITLHENEIDALQKVALANGDGQGSITTILPFDIFVTIDKTGSTSVKRHILKNCVFQSNGRDLSQGEGVIQTAIPILFSHIQWV